ncbi:MAG: BolA family transcriptional regulator [Pseudomonadota bacterium]|nr:BolA family transcriptional regulator [Pseudomonadota bacterium]
MNRSERIRFILTENLHPGHLEVRDESHKHIGHPGARPGGETHYEIIIKSRGFNGMSRVERHQAVYKLLADELKTGLHAVRIQADSEG